MKLFENSKKLSDHHASALGLMRYMLSMTE